ncbi:hypothetical protein Desdi_1276 [Desulfitobacterium dichloroeliminans LMG P-21439]|uniref:Uncharacterized protein n=2 Tax=Desulfitobacterium dichloroeliminans TaxID=233055 RepID=L0F748_DESDL|nr:hypothetical protein Desdi_1276 [Desulfitobacterium dichloroeliminans LMG P-21439]
MKMIEMRTCVDKDGRLVISEKTVGGAGFNPGDEVYVSLAVAKGETHPSPIHLSTTEPSNIIINPDDEDVFAPEDELHIPDVLLEAAGIPKDCSLGAFGGNGSLVFYNADEDEEDELEDESEDEGDLFVPGELLEAAGIPEDSDLDIIFTDGAIVIMEADILDNLPDELRDLFGNIGIDPDTVREVMRKEGYFV